MNQLNRSSHPAHTQAHEPAHRAEQTSHGILHRTVRRHPMRHGLAVLIGVLALWLAAPHAALAQTTGDEAIGPVFALRGTLADAENQPFATFLVLPNGTQIGLVGETPLIESDIVQLHADSANPMVKVWGIRYAGQTESDYDLIVVEEIQSAGVTLTPQPTPEPGITPEPTPTPEPTSAVPIAEIEVQAINVRSGPSTDYPAIATLTAGELCPIIGRNAEASWWRLSCSNGVRGWVFGQLISITGGLDLVPVVQTAPPPPPPTPTPAPPQNFSGWRAAYYDNRNLAGSPVLVQDVADISFFWGSGSPGAGVPADNFSAVFERTLNFSYGNYVLQTTVDDGVRVYVDGELVINGWNVGAARDLTFRRVLSGSHTFRIEYFEAEGSAQLRFVTRLLSTDQAWQASYFDNPNLTGSPVVQRGEPRGADYPMDFDWGLSSPVPNVVPANNWSARWEGTFNFTGGDYRFSTNVDDGIRVYIDGIQLINVWENGVHNGVSTVFQELGPGNHRITVEYFDNTSGAYLRLWWDRLGDGGGDNDDDDDDEGRDRDE